MISSKSESDTKKTNTSRESSLETASGWNLGASRNAFGVHGAVLSL